MDLFGNEEIRKTQISRYELEILLKKCLHKKTERQLVELLTNDFYETIEYYYLTCGQNTCQKTSLLFNSHRLSTTTKTSKFSVVSALNDEKYINGLARVMIHQAKKDIRLAIKTKDLLYQTLQYGTKGVQYVNEFAPYVARDIYKKFNVNKNSQILDPCAGWGGRMIGASAVSNNYECFEPATKTFNGLVKLSAFIKDIDSSFAPIINNLPFEDSILKKDYYDIALTSPPYYDTEHYSDENTNSLIRYDTFDKWNEMFYCPLIQKTMNSLKDGKTFVLNIGSRVYPLNKILINEFGKKYEIIKSDDNMIRNGNGFRTESEGETFYYIKK